MAVAAARELRDGDVVFVGIGLPNLACNLARATHAPNLVLIYESGAVGAVPERLPVSIGDPALVTDSLAVASMSEVFQWYLQGGRIQVGFLGGAQIDRYGNINSTVIGPYAHPKVRLPGSGGACEIAIHAERVIVVAPLSPRSFPSDVDFLTSPGQRNKYGTRSSLGLPGQGPVRIVTDVGILAPQCSVPSEARTSSEDDGELELIAIYPGVAPDDVKRKTGWPLKIRRELQTVEAPSAEELHLLRDVLDPDHLYV
jgi:glutaconate CoA-transferase subunit B